MKIISHFYMLKHSPYGKCLFENDSVDIVSDPLLQYARHKISVTNICGHRVIHLCIHISDLKKVKHIIIKLLNCHCKQI